MPLANPDWKKRPRGQRILDGLSGARALAASGVPGIAPVEKGI
jgi:hypothetical protein